MQNVNQALGAIRMTDVARMAGVARVTVSRVLSHPHSVAPATRALVMTAIEELGYHRNLNAGSLASSRSRLVAALVSTLTQPWVAKAVGGLADALGDADYQLIVAQADDDPRKLSRAINAFLGRRIDAVVFIDFEASAALLKTVAEASVPVIELASTDAGTDGLTVRAASYAAGYDAAVYLADQGCTTICTIGHADSNSSLCTGFDVAAAEWGDRAAFLRNAGHVTHTGPIDASFEFCQQPILRISDGVFCSSRHTARNLLAAFKMAGLRPPIVIICAGKYRSHNDGVSARSRPQWPDAARAGEHAAQALFPLMQMKAVKIGNLDSEDRPFETLR